MSAIGVLPCPFCGNTDPSIDEIDSGIWALCCDECRTIGPHTDGEQQPADAIKKWNERPA